MEPHPRATEAREHQTNGNPVEQHQAKGHAKRQAKERGAAMVELALIAPMLIIIALGIFEISVAWSEAQTAVQAARGGARTVTQTGQEEEADQIALRAVKAGFDDQWSDVKRVVVYEATSADGSPPAACVGAGVTSSPSGVNCNVYITIDLDNVTDASYFDNGADCGSGKSANWCPSSRNRDLDLAQWVGVWVEYERPWLSGLFSAPSYTITESTVMRMEPRAE